MAHADQKVIEHHLGEEMPEIKEKPREEKGKSWEKWIEEKLQEQEHQMLAKRLHWQQNREFKRGRQWISLEGGRRWKEPPKPRNRVRLTLNKVGPAINFRLGLIREQRPGWRMNPIPGQGNDARETALAQQALAEFYYFTQGAQDVLAYGDECAMTDGVAFGHVYTDKTAGPLIENVLPLGKAANPKAFEEALERGFKADEDEVIRIPLSNKDEPLDPGAQPFRFRAGDIRTRICKADEVWFDPESRTINGPHDPARWAFIRKPRDLKSAKQLLASRELSGIELKDRSDRPTEEGFANPGVENALPPFPSSRMKVEESVWDTLVFFPRSTAFPKGAWRRIVAGHVIAGANDGVDMIPLFRIWDGSTDGDIYPRPVMNDWIGLQKAINAVASLIQMTGRLGGGRLLGRAGTLIKETYTDIVGSMVTYQGAKPEIMRSLESSQDLKFLLGILTQLLDDMTGHGATARGQVTQGDASFQDVSGRAVLVARELFERQFGNMIRAAAQARTDWAELVISLASNLFDNKEGRLIPIVGRRDLAKKITGEMLEGPISTYADPETLMPMPRALRTQMLFDHLKNGLINVEEYKKASPFAEIRNLHTGSTDHVNRAQEINELIEENSGSYIEMPVEQLYSPGGGPLIYFQDDAGVHMRVLEELILDDRASFEARRLAMDRWGIYSELQQAKASGAAGAVDPNTGAPLPPFPVPFEVIGTPPSFPVSQGRSGAVVGASGQGATDPTTSLASPAPDLAGALPQAAAESAQPLGAFGAIETAGAGPAEL